MQQRELAERKRRLAEEQKRDLELKNKYHVSIVQNQQEFDKGMRRWMIEDLHRK